MEVGCFEIEFDEWGFEHFELAFRLQKNGMKICRITDNSNYHIPHSKNSNFYFEAMNKSVEIMNKKHNNYNFYPLIDYMSGKISLQKFERIFSGHNSSIKCDKEIYYII